VSLPAAAVTLPGPRLDAALALIAGALRGESPHAASARR
jgi:hypothetical protein